MAWPVSEPPYSELLDNDAGSFAVTTETSRYLLDLSGRKFRRTPRLAARPLVGDDGARLVLVRHRSDSSWLQLIRLIVCRLAEPMVLVGRHGKAMPSVWVSTLVVAIEEAPRGT